MQYLLKTSVIIDQRKAAVKSLDEIVFEHRNKEYGGYDLRTSYRRYMIISYSLVLGLFVIVSLLLLLSEIFPSFGRNKKNTYSNLKPVQYDHDLLPVIGDLSFHPIVRPNLIKPGEEQGNVALQVRKTQIIEKTPIREYKPEQIVNDTAFNLRAEDLLKRHKNNVQNTLAQKKDTLSIILEKAPLFPGGYGAVQSFFLKNQHYPENALRKGIQGSSLVSFIVSTQGVVQNAKIVEGLDPELDREALRLVSLMPNWQPAYYKGKPIACKLIMPVDFTIR